jgi:hypothetical protein
MAPPSLEMKTTNRNGEPLDRNMALMKVMTSHDIAEYLQEMLHVLRHDDDDFQLALNQKHHRPKMMRAIVGISKGDFKQQLRDLQCQHQWKAADAFIRQDLQSIMMMMMSSSTNAEEQQAPNFAPNLQRYLQNGEPSPSQQQEQQQRQQQPCAKFFSSLASGRTYQGKFERLLEDLAPHLLPKFQSIVADMEEEALLQLFVLHEHRQRERSATTATDGVTEEDAHLQLQQCLDMEFVQAPPESVDGGRSKGKRGEIDLNTYLATQYGHLEDYRVLSPVWIRPLGSHKSKSSNNKKCQYVMEIPLDEIYQGMTNEFDAMVVHVRGETMTIHQVWDAKATLDPPALHDILRKKVSALASILDTEKLPNITFVVPSESDPNSLESFKVEVHPVSNSTLPQIGVFGSKLPTPRAAARRLQVTVCEILLETNKNVATAVLKESTGKMAPPPSMVEEYAWRLLSAVEQVQPIMVVPDTTDFEG